MSDLRSGSGHRHTKGDASGKEVGKSSTTSATWSRSEARSRSSTWRVGCLLTSLAFGQLLGSSIWANLDLDDAVRTHHR
eukprot:1165564-Pyramimonas_sp.AAC.1